MGGEHHAAEAFHQLPQSLKGNVRAVDQQVRLRGDAEILLIADLLLPEDLLLIGEFHQPCVYIGVKIQRRFQGREQADRVHLLGGVDLHAGDRQHSELLRQL